MGEMTRNIMQTTVNSIQNRNKKKKSFLGGQKKSSVIFLKFWCEIGGISRKIKRDGRDGEKVGCNKKQAS